MLTKIYLKERLSSGQEVSGAGWGVNAVRRGSARGSGGEARYLRSPERPLKTVFDATIQSVKRNAHQFFDKGAERALKFKEGSRNAGTLRTIIRNNI